MTFDNLIFRQESGIATIKLKRPEAFNALDFNLGSEWVKALEICHDDPDTKVIVITGEGKAFCAGGDLALFKNSSDTSDTLRQIIKSLNWIILGIRRVPKPVIASINGVTSGAGMSIAAACDLRICTSSAKFKQAYTSVGLVPDGAWTLFLPSLIGLSKASELAFLDPLFDAQEAFRLGFVNKIVDDSQLEQETYAIAEKIARGPALAYKLVKANLNEFAFRNLEYQLELERTGMTAIAKTLDSKEGIDAFLGKRKPAFVGK